ncbi:unnamed protein product [Penicillium roqueforti FM164]|uniref:Genomic scaffold, ProqFM164S01 n=1 Tax=Penicillium roqueforti (strain FM164) TaxID=1365484 RepID=W6PR58_PENRF|nr:unnamed protein product [Penicillium roqueforti FM164]
MLSRSTLFIERSFDSLGFDLDVTCISFVFPGHKIITYGKVTVDLHTHQAYVVVVMTDRFSMQ